MIDLWGEDIPLEDEKKQSKKISKKLSQSNKSDEPIEKIIKSKKLSVLDRLNLITKEVDRVLGHYRSQTLVVHTREELHSYIDKAVECGIIGIDTETNNSLDPITCKIMGLCLYVPNEKQVYVPINHTTIDGVRLDWQLNENDIREELERLGNTFTVYHNGKFDYQVLKETCGFVAKIDWDTSIAIRLIDENKFKDKETSLKYLYTTLIDTNQEMYHIDKLFEGVPYAIVDPDIFALYSAADPYMTYKLYEWEKVYFDSKEFDGVRKLFFDVEMPMVQVVAEMELNGIEIDQDYAKRLGDKYHKQIDELKVDMDKELDNLKPTIAKWRLTPEANKKEIRNGKETKSKSEQLDDPINLDSPSQLAILLYDILKSKVIDKDSPRGTGKEIIEQMDFPICKLIVSRKKLVKLSKDFIDLLPTKVNVDGRIHCNFHQLGTDTGRFSSTSPNLQQIPSYEKSIRKMFKASMIENTVTSDEDVFEVPYTDEVETSDGYVLVKNLKIGDKLIIDEKEEELKNISCINNMYKLYI